MRLKHDRHLQWLAVGTEQLGHGMLLDPVEMSLRETWGCCEAKRDAGLQYGSEGGYAGSRLRTPSLARF